ncbi:MAG: hypothetical protein IS860_03755 [Nitrosopumilus sp.]|nr:hypothetical protein [Nitrosopumilus sp.]
MSADLVIGQTDFTSFSTGTSATKLKNPRNLAFDSSGDLWVLDNLNERVLRFSLNLVLQFLIQFDLY